MKLLNNGPIAPWWWKRAESAGIMFFTGAIPIVSLVQGIDPVIRDNLTNVFLPLSTLLVKTMGMWMGDSAATPTNSEQKQELRQAEQALQQKWQEQKDEPE
jgi:hypothetical protein